MLTHGAYAAVMLLPCTCKHTAPSNASDASAM